MPHSHKITESLAKVWELEFEVLLLQPFGNGNSQPVFFARGVEPSATPRLIKEKHFMLRLRQKNLHQRAIFFDGAREPLPPPPWDIAFQIKAGEYVGQERLELHVQAIRHSVPVS